MSGEPGEPSPEETPVIEALANDDAPTAEVSAALDLGHGGGWNFERRPGEPSAAYQLRRLDNAIGLAEAVLLCLFVAALISVAAFQAITGNLFGKTYSGTNEIIRYSVFCIAMTGSALAAQRKRLISMDIFSRLLSAKARATLRVALALFTVAMCVLLVRGSWNVYLVARGEDHLVIPKALSVFFLPAGATLIGFHIAVHAVIDALYLLTGATAPEPRAGAH